MVLVVDTAIAVTVAAFCLFVGSTFCLSFRFLRLVVLPFGFLSAQLVHRVLPCHYLLASMYVATVPVHAFCI